MLDLDPGRYGAFIWPAFAITLVVFAGMALDSLARARRWRRAVERLERAARGDAEPR